MNAEKVRTFNEWIHESINQWNNVSVKNLIELINW